MVGLFFEGSENEAVIVQCPGIVMEAVLSDLRALQVEFQVTRGNPDPTVQMGNCLGQLPDDDGLLCLLEIWLDHFFMAKIPFTIEPFA